jgi:hypothetical protein
MEDIDIFESLDPYAKDEEPKTESTYVNPLFLNFGGSVVVRYEKTANLASKYKHVYILCVKKEITVLTEEDVNEIRNIYNDHTDIERIKKLNKYLVAVEGPFDIIFEARIKSGVCTVGRELIEVFCSHKVEDEHNLIYPMLNFSEIDVLNWISVYQNKSNLDQIIRSIILYSYNQLVDRRLEDDIIRKINNLSISQYWEDPKHCTLNLVEDFTKRRFNLNLKWDLPIEKIEQELKKLLQEELPKEKKERKNVSSGSPTFKDHDESNAHGVSSTSSISSTSNKSNQKKVYPVRSFFQPTNRAQITITKETVNELLCGKSLTHRQRYYLLCNVLASKDYCHYAINNAQVLKANADILAQYKLLFRYLIGYAWVTFYLEEQIRGANTRKDDRFVFDLGTANLLPVYPFEPTDAHSNPYFTALLPDTTVNKVGLGCIKPVLDYQKGIVDLKEFKERLNTFISGDIDIDLLEGIDWSHMAITGGCMAGIMPAKHPLLASVNTYNRFFNEFYSDSDVDVACNHVNILDYVAHVKHFKDKLEENLNKDRKTKVKLKVDALKSLAIYINKVHLKTYCEKHSIPFSYDYVIKNKDNNDVKHYFYNIYLDQKKKHDAENISILGDKINDPEYYRIISYVDYDNITIVLREDNVPINKEDYRVKNLNSGLKFIFYVKAGDGLNESYDETDTENEEKEADGKEDDKENNSDDEDNPNKEQCKNFFLKFNENLKFKISSKHLNHDFELFRVDNDFFSAVARFHLPCVRSYYDGKTCYLLPSAITAYHTMMNIDFRYFVGANDPIHIRHKYRRRGYGFVDNGDELKQDLACVLTMDDLMSWYDIDNQSKNVKEIIGNLEINHKFYEPIKTTPDKFPSKLHKIYNGYYTKFSGSYLNHEAVVAYYKNLGNKSEIDLLSYRAIGADGNVVPLKKWTIDACY